MQKVKEIFLSGIIDWQIPGMKVDLITKPVFAINFFTVKNEISVVACAPISLFNYAGGGDCPVSCSNMHISVRKSKASFKIVFFGFVFLGKKFSGINLFCSIST